jgi:hypothetical protein
MNCTETTDALTDSVETGWFDVEWHGLCQDKLAGYELYPPLADYPLRYLLS